MGSEIEGVMSTAPKLKVAACQIINRLRKLKKVSTSTYDHPE